jgi:hypothetical protein
MFNIKILWKMVSKSFKKLAELIIEFILVPIIVLKMSSLCTFPRSFLILCVHLS